MQDRVLVYSIEKENTNIIKSNDIICPTCKEICKYDIKNHRIKLYDCKNKHINDNIKFEDFNNKQNMDMSEIKCDKCKNNTKSNTFHNEFFICNECKMNLCPLCKSVHNKSHFTINYDDKNYICNKHNETFVKYCYNCEKDLCFLCLKEHKDHATKSYEDLLIDPDILKKSMKNFKININKFKKNLEEIITKFQDIIENMDLFYNINDEIIHNYELSKKRNYNLLININNIKDSIDIEINKIKDIYNYGHCLNSMLYLYNELKGENVEIEMSYLVKENNKNIQEIGINKEKEEKLRIFGECFVKNNIYKCKILYNDTECELNENFYPDEDDNLKEPIKFK